MSAQIQKQKDSNVEIGGEVSYIVITVAWLEESSPATSQNNRRKGS